MNLWLIAGIVILAVLIFKFKDMRHKIGLVAVTVLLLFLVVSFAQVYSSHDLKLDSFDGIVSAGKTYFSWLGGILGNAGKISSYAIKQDWGVNNTLGG